MESCKEQPFKKYICFKKLRLVASNKYHLRSNQSQFFETYALLKWLLLTTFHLYGWKSSFWQKMLNLSLNELKQIAKMRGIMDYSSMSEERLVSSLN